MTTPETSTDYNSEIAALKSQLFTLLIALIVVSGTLTVYLYRQTSMAGKDLAQAQQINNLVVQNEIMINNFAGKLVAYGEKHSDFLPVLKKYGLVSASGTPASAPPVAPKK